MKSRGATVLVTDGEQRAALAATRSLGAAGYRVLVAAAGRRSLAGASRHADGKLRTPHPGSDRSDYVETIAEAVRQHDVAAILPVTEPALLALLSQGEHIGDAVIAGPTFAAFEAIRDKAALLARAAALGIDTPEQVLLRTAADPVPADLDFPVAIKPARSIVAAGDDGPMERVGVRYARDAESLRNVLARYPVHAYPLLVQRYIEGPGTGAFLLLHQGRVLARFAHRRIREKPPTGGVSVCCESVPLDPDVLDVSARLLESYDWQGPAMVEYKLETATGRAWLMEVNGRFWGSLQLAIHAGVDFPRLLIDATLDRPVTPVHEWRHGIRNHWEWGEVDSALLRVRAATGAKASAAWRAMREVLDLRRGRDRTEVFRLRDPLPFLVESAAWLKRG